MGKVWLKRGDKQTIEIDTEGEKKGGGGVQNEGGGKIGNKLRFAQDKYPRLVKKPKETKSSNPAQIR